MRGQRPGRAVAALTVLALVLVVLSGVLTALTPADSGLDLVSALVFLLLPVSFSLVGGLLGVRLPGHGVGRLCLAIGLLWSLQSAGFWLAVWLASRGEPAAAGWIALVG